jgi:hypothetical protein
VANKAIPGWTQVPVTADDILSAQHDRIVGTTTLNVLIVYQIKDTLGAVRGQRRVTTTVTGYPLSGAAALALCNTQEGT